LAASDCRLPQFRTSESFAPRSFRPDFQPRRRQDTTPRPIDWPDNLPALYSGYVDQLAATLSDEGVVGRASDELHKIIDRVAVRHDANRDVHELEIEGDLVELLSKAKPAGEAGYVASRSSLNMVAGAGFEPAAFRL
jgi:site-specific DNA recombinase